jgi:phospholipase/carboxylesterase
MLLLPAALLALGQPAPPAPSPSPSAAQTPRLVHQSRTFPLPDDAVAYVPASAGPRPPLLVLLHGAGRTRLWMIDHFKAEADKRGIVLLAPTSKGVTWDAVSNALTPGVSDSPLEMKLGRRYSTSRDAKRVDAAIANLAKIVPVDLARTVLAGFSDGATFALAMGMARSERFSAVIAWSPGIAIETALPARGRRVFVSHGTRDPTLHFAVTCGEIVPLLRSEGAKVGFMAFDGVHQIPEEAKDAFLDAAFGAVAGTQPRPLPTETPACPCDSGMQSLFVVGEPTGYRRNATTGEGVQRKCGGGD